MKTMRNFIDRIQEYIIIFLTGLCIIVGTLQVIGRFLIHYSIPWSEEFIRYSFVWITFLGASLAVRENVHARVSFFLEILSKPIQRALNILSNLICIVFSTVIIVEGINIIMMQLQTKQLTSAMEIPIAFIFLAIPVSAVTMIFYFLTNIIKNLHQLVQN
jgi:TRAP-type C4-dicarboxylate transport system permease small subunit